MTTEQTPEFAHLAAMYENERAAKKIAADVADRFRDVLSECLGHENARTLATTCSFGNSASTSARPARSRPAGATS